MATSSQPWVFRDVVRMDEKVPCCAADALRKIFQREFGSEMVGITMHDHIRAQGHTMNHSGEKEIGNELLKKMKVYNYIPSGAEEEFRAALVRENTKSEKTGA